MPKRTPIPGSERKASTRLKPAAKPNLQQRIEVTVMLRPRVDAHEALAADAHVEDQPRFTRDEIADRTGAHPDDIAKVEGFAHDHDLTVTMVSVPQRIVKLSGTLGNLAKAFGANMKQFRVGKVVYRGRTGSLTVPAELAPIVIGVFGFSTLPVARPHYRMDGSQQGGCMPSAKSKMRSPAKKPKGATKAPALAMRAASPALKPFTPPQVAALYDFPAGLTGKGQCVAIIELNTPNENGQMGTGYSAPDLKAYFKKLGIPMPKVSAVGVSGGANLPNVNPDADGEVMLDVEVVGAIAPGAQIAVYFAPNTSQGFIDAINAAVHDKVRKPSIVSISWGGPEDPPYTSAQMRTGMEQVLQDAVHLGVTVCCASGDDGSADLPLQDGNGGHPRDRHPHVDYPASSAFALACGGTSLVANGNSIGSEVAWNEGDPTPQNDSPSGAGGGGVSNLSAKPAYQSMVNVPKSPKGKVGRGVPDVAGNADSASGYLCKLQGIPQLVPIGGTSAVAPLWAGLLARVNEKRASLGKASAGFVNPVLYRSGPAFHDIRVGDNDIDGTLKEYATAPGWDPCTGMGSPVGTKILQALIA